MSNKKDNLNIFEERDRDRLYYLTTNKSNRDIDKKFDQKNFNKKFEDNENIKDKELKNNNSEDMLQKHYIIDKILPHKKPIEDIIINIREMFYKILEMLIDKQNPIPYIFSSPDRHFSFSILLIILGSLLLLFSNLMISN